MLTYRTNITYLLIACSCLIHPMTLHGQDFFFRNHTIQEKAAERTFFESMETFLPPDRDDGPCDYIRSMDPSSFEEWITWIMEEAMIPGISLCFLENGDLYWKKHFGYANIEQAVPVSDSTIFLTASISKTIVLTACMQLYENGLFKLDDNINDYLPFEVYNPSFPDSIITFRHLMTHLSSINDDLTLLNDLVTYGYDSPIALQDFLQSYLLEGGMYNSSQSYLQVPPQTTYNYSNVGVSLLAFIVEVLLGMDFESYCQQHIFGPLGMEQTSFRLENLDSSWIATPYIHQSDVLIPTPHAGFPVYPAGTLRTSAVNLSKILAMYMNGGSLDQVQILKESTIDLITTLQYPEKTYPDLLGLIWNFNYGFFSHGGSFPGAQGEYGFSWDRQSGMICIGNSSNSDWSWFTEYLLLNYSYHYKPFSVEALALSDSDGDQVLEPGEEATITLGIRNNINITSAIQDVHLILCSDDPNISIEVAESPLGMMEYLEVKKTLNIPFMIHVGSEIQPYSSMFGLNISFGKSNLYETYLNLEIGNPDILLVNDGISFDGMFIQPISWYTYALKKLQHEAYSYNLNVMGEPSPEFISNFPVVIWFTGFQEEQTLTPYNQEVLSQYLENGGNLFLSGQNISEDLEESPFLKDYLHVKHINDTYTGQDTLIGTPGDPIGDNLYLTFNQGMDAMYQLSMSELEPVSGGEVVFQYFSSATGAAISYQSPVYKTVFFGFGFEGINELEKRLEVLQRILEFFGSYVGTEEEPVQTDAETVRIFPNPLQDPSLLSYVLERPGMVSLMIYDAKGSLVRKVDGQFQTAGIHHLAFQPGELLPGMYLYRFICDEISEVKKLLVTP
ncbi:MAG: serine hydrolase [Bacteroidales bacterium]|nr:serine hydrolase [Lentimicrobiaceae bacterium]MDD5694741.1 serine hydrolase [Bacteroidales bacterium]